MREAFLDTDILSETLKKRDATVVRRARAYSEVHPAFTFSMVTVHEIVFGLLRKGSSRQVEEARRVFTDNRVIAPTYEDFERSGTIRAIAQRSGRQLTFADCLVGATAERLGLPVVTGNTAHFQAMIDAGLRVELENWRND